MRDTGCSIRNAVAGMKQYGCCKEDICQYNPAYINRKPPPQCYSRAKNYCITDAMQVPANLTKMKACLADGYPFAFGLELFQSFQRAGSNKGRVPMPSSFESQMNHHGWHAMLAVGYSDKSKCFIVRNSWGTQWVRLRF
ncbi:unnamed protein product [Rotaria sp. Silwood2]|nr:unnamed protein product [Rotaria sp. Silwood2]CAF4513929.1 unnamed protein product [Rotaria sp. Silwood2]